MATAFIFYIFFQTLLYAICSGKNCSEGWEEDITRYRILNFREDSYVHVSCKFNNYKVDGEDVIKCVDGQLPAYLPHCILMKASCQNLKAPTYGSMRCSSNASDVGTSCSFECQSSHYLRGSQIRHCHNNLRWTGTETRCFRKPKCSEPPPLLNGSVNGCSPERKPKYNDTCYFQCNEGFQLDGPSYLICRLHGKLTDERGHQRFPSCRPISDNEDVRNRTKPVSPTSWYSCQVHNGYCSHHCHQESKGIHCSCRGGYGLSLNGRTCIDIDECKNKSVNKCDHVCRNTVGGYQCLCREGYKSPDGFKCEDIDECLDDKLNKCEHICENTIGHYSCSCREGFVSVGGFRCEGCRVNSYRIRIDVACRDCPANSHTDGEEKTSINDCICNSGFTGNPGQGIPCKDTDECEDEKKFGCSHICYNTPGSAYCACPVGYQLKEDQKTCIDIDECSIKNGGCDGICLNAIGNFSCSCVDGYVASPNDKYRCDDVDECADKNGGCSEKCVNFKGGFHCACSEGFHLHPDGKSCDPVYCPRVSVPHHSTLRCKRSETSRKVIFSPGEMPEDEEFPVGTICRIKCDKGYNFRDIQTEIVCQNDGKWNALLSECHVLQCPPLSPPLNGDVYPSSCKEGSSVVKQKCLFTCNSGYRITGQEVLTCRNNLTWSKKKPTQCVPETEVVSISCPDDDIIIELMSNESWAEIQLNSPRTSLSELIRVSPPWVSLNRVSQFPAGETEVTFSVTSNNKTAECSISVVVLDKHPPVFQECPDSLSVTSSIAGTEVNWEEPVPEDNVGIASVTKSLEPNSTLRPGIHFVEYVARDFAGNIGQCLFQINITATSCKDLEDPENGDANCFEWTFGKICQPTCSHNYTRPSELFTCDESGTWAPTDFISPCLPE